MTDRGAKSSNVIYGRFEQYQDGAEVTAPLSQPAIRLHFFGMLASFQRGRAGYISDRYLAAIDTGASSSAIAELLDAGLWERIDDGFQVRQLEIMRIATELAYHLAQQPLTTSASPPTSDDASQRVGHRQINTGRRAGRRKGANRADDPATTPRAAARARWLACTVTTPTNRDHVNRHPNSQ